MKTSQFAILAVLVVGSGFASVENAFAKDKASFQGSISTKGKSKSEYSTLAKISLQDAIAVATKTTSGKVIEAGLDSESGFLVYEIEVSMPDRTRKELLIDAGDGRVLHTKDEKNNSEDEEENE